MLQVQARDDLKLRNVQGYQLPQLFRTMIDLALRHVTNFLAPNGLLQSPRWTMPGHF